MAGCLHIALATIAVLWQHCLEISQSMKPFVILLALTALIAGCVTESDRTGQLPPDSGAGLGGTGTGSTATPGAGTSGIGIVRPASTGGDRAGFRLFKRPRPTVEFNSGSQTTNSPELERP